MIATLIAATLTGVMPFRALVAQEPGPQQAAQELRAYIETLQQDIAALDVQRKQSIASIDDHQKRRRGALAYTTTQDDQSLILRLLRAPQPQREASYHALMHHLALSPINRQDLHESVVRLQALLALRNQAQKRLASLPKPTRLPSPAAEQIEIQMPLKGDMIVRFGEALPNGTSSLGIIFTATPGEGIRSPLPGIVEFVGEIDRYGRTLIIEHPDGYHSLFVGVDDVAAEIGQEFEQGAVVAQASPQARRSSLMTSAPVTSVYFELREHGMPIDPLSAPTFVLARPQT